MGFAMRSIAFALSLILVSLTTVSAAEPNPLPFVPPQANVVVRIENPRRLIQSVAGVDLIRQMKDLPFVRERVQTPVAQRIQQLIEYYEKDLGAKWPDLLDRLAGGGITLALKAGDDAPVLLTIEGKDADLSSKFLELVASVVEQEAGGDAAKKVIERPMYRGIKEYKAGEFVVAQAGTTILASNKLEAMKLALDRQLDGGKSPAYIAGPSAARKALPADCLAWMWLDLDLARKAPGAKETLAQPSDNAFVTVLFGGWLDVVRRAPFLAVGLVQDNDKIGLTLRFPGAGHEGQPEQMLLHAPPNGEGIRPPLEPKGVILSESFWFDFKALWEKRAKLFNEKTAKDFENSEKQARPFLPNMSLAKLFTQAGASHRFVVAQQESVGYTNKPKQPYPNFAFVMSMRDKEFARSMEGVLRAAALLAGTQFNLKLAEETYEGVKIVGYRFPEKGNVASDPDGIRFNFSPCFAAVGDQFAMCSTIEFGHEIVKLLQKEAASPAKAANSSPLCTRLYGPGAVDLVRGFEEQVLGQIILDEAVKPEDAHRQMQALADWLRRLGQLEFRSVYLDKEYRFDIEWRRSK
jgi:hypothetical protein